MSPRLEGVAGKQDACSELDCNRYAYPWMVPNSVSLTVAVGMMKYDEYNDKNRWS